MNRGAMAGRMKSRLLFCVFSSLSLLHAPILADTKSYVVYLGQHAHGLNATEEDYERAKKDHVGLLGSYLGCNETAQKALFYSYRRCINGFGAHLDEEQAQEILKNPNVVSVIPNQRNEMHTTRSWTYLGLERDGIVPSYSLWTKARFGEDTIIGNFDSGVWPESQSFNDQGMGPVPSRWKGLCINNTKEGVQCNRKLIGARYFAKGYDSVWGPAENGSFYSTRDTNGHGTHTLSTAGGRFVPGASMYGYGMGTAKGGSPSARVASYKVCWPTPAHPEGSCFDADMVAAFDAAIHDGVDVLSLSAGKPPNDYFQDPIAIGSFHAVMNGIIVVCSAGNSGPNPSTVTNLAPWILTVAASSIDRQFASYLRLGNNKTYKGRSLSSDHLPEKMYPLTSGLQAKATNVTAADAERCIPGSLDPVKVTGKIVICIRGNNTRFDKTMVVKQAGGVGMIFANDEVAGDVVFEEPYSLPVTHITYSQGIEVLSYITSTQSPVGYITQPAAAIGAAPTPVMATFSSRGPNSITPQILKPDVTAPGVSILAAFTQAKGPAGISADDRRVLFKLDSGTSMSCPHVAGIAALLKTLHPDWSPAAIRSAIMTTALANAARSEGNDKKAIMEEPSLAEATPLAYGAGEVQPNQAMDPGLIYDITMDEYLKFLCGLGYDSDIISAFAAYKCPAPEESMNPLDLNYPSITVPSLTAPTTITRRVRNVGSSPAAVTYTAKLVPPTGVSVSVNPSTLRFKNLGDEQTFTVTFAPTPEKPATGNYVFGRLTWSDGLHQVASPLVVS